MAAPVIGKIHVSVIIVTWNGRAYAMECLQSLRDLGSTLQLEVIVVDNASSDGTPEAIKEHFPEVTLLRNTRNLGFAQANNIGIKASSGDYVALINSDVVVPPGCIESMVDFLQTHGDVGLLGPKMLSPNGELGISVNKVPTVWNYLCSALGLHTVFPQSKLFGGYLMPDYPYDKTEDVGILTGWFWLVPRKALDQVGYLDERFFMYGEDLDWSYRFHLAGWRVVFYAEAEALHYGAASSGLAPARFYLEKTKANFKYFIKHYKISGAVGFLLATGIHELVRLAGNTFLYCFARHNRATFSHKLRRSSACLKWLLLSATQFHSLVKDDLRG